MQIKVNGVRLFFDTEGSSFEAQGLFLKERPQLLIVVATAADIEDLKSALPAHRVQHHALLGSGHEMFRDAADEALEAILSFCL